MKYQECKNEEKFITNYLSNSLSENDKKHLTECENCNEAVLTAVFLKNLSEELTPPENPANSSVLFSMAESVLESEAKDIVLRPIKFMNYIFGVFTTVMIFTLGYMSKGLVEELFQSQSISKYFTISIDLSGLSWIYTSVIGKLLIGAFIVLFCVMTLISVFEQFENKHIGIGKH